MVGEGFKKLVENDERSVFFVDRKSAACYKTY